MSLAHLIRSRRSVHPPAYNNKPIAAEDINAILEAARWAPTHKKT
ncbi:MAG: nitroreductase family protein, partial [Flavobacteriaceae bacterium]